MTVTEPTYEKVAKLGVKREDLEEVKAAEVGNIFSFGGAKSEQLGLMFKDEQGVSSPVVLGSYGIGVTRLMGVMVECFSDDKGIVWPEAVAPFKVHVLSLGQDEEAGSIYRALTDAGIEALFDDRETGAGAKFADSDLIGIPYRIVVSKKSLEQGGVEVKKRTNESSEIMTADAFLEMMKQ